MTPPYFSSSQLSLFLEPFVESTARRSLLQILPKDEVLPPLLTEVALILIHVACAREQQREVSLSLLLLLVVGQHVHVIFGHGDHFDAAASPAPSETAIRGRVVPRLGEQRPLARVFQEGLGRPPLHSIVLVGDNLIDAAEVCGRGRRRRDEGVRPSISSDAADLSVGVGTCTVSALAASR